MTDELLNKMLDVFFLDFKSKLQHYDVYIQFWYHDDFHKTIELAKIEKVYHNVY